MLIGTLFFVFISLEGRASFSCECEKIECESCLEEQGVTFYSEKCGPNNSRIKSCARPTCVPLDPLPSKCRNVKLQKNKVNRSVASHSPQNLPASKKMMNARMKELKNELRGKEVGTVHTVMGKAFLKLPSGDEVRVTKGARVHEKDQIRTRLRGHVKIVFDDGNITNIKPSTEIIVEEYEMGKSKKAILDLIKGKVRSKVKQKYNGKSSFFQVKTKSAVAGVRGTDFVVEYSEKSRQITKVTTLKGEVRFGGLEYKERVPIEKGQQASFIVAKNDSEVFSDDEISDFVAKGYMTPVYSLSEAELNEITNVTEVGELVTRAVASQKLAAICKSPKGELNQCYWHCSNNPNNAHRCRTDLPQVNCIRKKCDANGEWSDESRLPASFYNSCLPQGYRLGPCDY